MTNALRDLNDKTKAKIRSGAQATWTALWLTILALLPLEEWGFPTEAVGGWLSIIVIPIIAGGAMTVTMTVVNWVARYVPAIGKIYLVEAAPKYPME